MNIMRFAEMAETSGIEFYRKLAATTREDGVRRVCSLLIQGEQEQLERLQTMLARFPELASLESRELDSVVNPFEPPHSPDYSGLESDLETYRMAREFERQLLHRYQQAELRENDPEVKKALHWLASLERYELDEIEQLYNFVNAPNESLEWGEFSNLDEFHYFGRYEDLRQGDLEDPVIPQLPH